MKYHKISKVDKSICTAEQMIAYNYAQAYCWKYHAEYIQQDKFVQADAISEMVNQCIKLMQCNEKIMQKYNIDAIQSALHAGLNNYLCGKYGIFTNYAEIGKTFPAYYLDK